MHTPSIGLSVHTRRGAGWRQQGQIQISSLQLIVYPLLLQRENGNPDIRCLPFERGKKRHGNGVQGIVGSGERQRQLGAGRIKIRRL